MVSLFETREHPCAVLFLLERISPFISVLLEMPVVMLAEALSCAKLTDHERAHLICTLAGQCILGYERVYLY